MTDIFKVPKGYHVPYESVKSTAEEIYASFCRFIEDANTPQYEIKMLNRTPIFLFDKAKAIAAMAYCESLQGIDAVMHLPFETFIMVDPIGVVFLDGVLVSREDWENSIPQAEMVMLSNMIHDQFHKHEHDPNFEPDSWKKTIKAVLPSVFKTLDTTTGIAAKADEAWVGIATVFLAGKDVIGRGIDYDMLHSGLVAVCRDKRTVPDGWLGLPISHHISVKDGGKVRDIDDREVMGNKPLQSDFLTNVMTALGQARYVVQPKMTLIEDSPRKPRDPIASKRPIRSQERPVIRFLDPEELRVVYEGTRVPQGTHASPVPHTRMGHARTFKHERYIKMRGKTIFIHEIHVKAGDSWKSPSGRIYKVMEKDKDE
jgi:hypothetical protein